MAGYQYSQNISSLFDDFTKMESTLKNEVKSTMKEIADELKGQTEAYMPRSRKGPKHGVHMADDVKSSVSVGQKKATATVKGGKATGSLWFIVDNGHIAQNGNFIPGAHFTDKAYAATEVSNKVDALLNRVTKDG